MSVQGKPGRETRCQFMFLSSRARLPPGEDRAETRTDTGFPTPVKSPGVGDGQRLEDPADRHAGFGTKQQVKVIGHQAVAIEPKRIPKLGPAEALKKGAVVFIVGENDAAVITAINRVIKQAVVGWSEWSSHARQLPSGASRTQRKNNRQGGLGGPKEKPN